MANYDDLIRGTFDAIGAPPSYITPAYRAEDYASLYAKPSGGITPAQLAAIRAVPANSYQQPIRPTYSPYMTASERAQLEKQIAESRALQASIGKTPTAVATGPAWNTPTSIDLAAIEAANKPKTATVGPTLDDLLAYAQSLPNDPTKGRPAVATALDVNQPVTKVSATMQPGKPRGGLFEMLFGGGGNAGGSRLGGLAGLLAGNIPAPRSGPTGVGTNGYSYVNGQNVGYSPTVQAQREAQGKAIGDANRKNPNPTYTVTGDNNAFMPRSVQNSVRWQTGY